MIWTRPGGSDDGPLLVLLHGLGATAEAWRGVEEVLPDAWSGGWLAVDLPGHGRSSWTPPYTFEAQGAAIDEVLPEDRELVLLGHSMGAMPALCIAAKRANVGQVIGFSIKTYWPPTHLAGLQRQAEVDGGWRVAQDPASFDFGVPDMRLLVDASSCRLTLARGSEDHLVRPENVSEYVDDPVTLDGLGHNPHVEDPAAVVGLLNR